MNDTQTRAYTLCRHCDHFVDKNDDWSWNGEDNARYVHLENGEQDFDHDAEPNHDSTQTLAQWRELAPELFIEHADGAIGPNSIHHSRRGKDDSQH